MGSITIASPPQALSESSRGLAEVTEEEYFLAKNTLQDLDWNPGLSDPQAHAIDPISTVFRNLSSMGTSLVFQWSPIKPTIFVTQGPSHLLQITEYLSRPR